MGKVIAMNSSKLGMFLSRVSPPRKEVGSYPEEKDSQCSWESCHDRFWWSVWQEFLCVEKHLLFEQQLCERLAGAWIEECRMQK
jgi:hypothetical protein